MRNLFKTISLVFHPLIVAYIGFIILSFRLSYFMYPTKMMMIIALFAFLLMVIFPALLLFVGYKLKVFGSLHFEQKEERYVPLLITGIIYYLAYYLLSSLKIPGILQLYLLGSILTVIVSMLITIVWKISLHMLAIGSVCGMVLGLSSRLSINFIPEIIALIIISGLIASSRLYLNAHNKSQVYVGFLLGFFGMATLFILL
jgi:membrane-associated phospholipid phosphatase